LHTLYTNVYYRKELHRKCPNITNTRYVCICGKTNVQRVQNTKNNLYDPIENAHVFILSLVTFKPSDESSRNFFRSLEFRISLNFLHLDFKRSARALSWFGAADNVQPLSNMLNDENVRWLFRHHLSSRLLRWVPSHHPQMRSKYCALIWLKLRQTCDSGLTDVVSVDIWWPRACQEQIQHGISIRS
jgi:hypothetical protein